jgi:hypothetical protein
VVESPGEEVSDRTTDTPPVDPTAVSRAYRFHRARRRARVEHTRATRRAGLRFWFVLVLLLAASTVLAVTFWRQVQELFGL